MSERATTDGMRAPRQARSQDSTGRLLDAALAILARDGMAGLTTAAVSRESGVSNGALYHRFRDRRNLLLAAQDRFLSRLETDWLAATALIGQESRREILPRLIKAILGVFAEYRDVFQAFMVSGHDDPALRERGAETSRRMAGFVTGQLAERFGCSPDAADTAYRILFGQLTLIALFPDNEVSALAVPAEVRTEHMTRALEAVLGS